MFKKRKLFIVLWCEFQTHYKNLFDFDEVFMAVGFMLLVLGCNNGLWIQMLQKSPDKNGSLKM